jgi:hypothetical protein
MLQCNIGMIMCNNQCSQFLLKHNSCYSKSKYLVFSVMIG